MQSNAGRLGRSMTILGSVVLALGWAGPSAAQSTTAGIQGKVVDETGILPGATVTAREVLSGFTHEAVSASDGTFTLAGLRPGRYEIQVSMSQYKPQAKTVQVLVGQTATLDFKVTPDLLFVESVTVVGELLVETRTAEVATNVSDEQIRHLPQNSRNFLNFASLAPGLRVSPSDDASKQVTAGALGARSINVFIDGVSYKNDVIEGGVIGQDSSRGNPFPQDAVQEFQVITQNFKAEFEKASSAIISAVTKSGGNRFTGGIFGFYQDKRLVQNEAMVNVGGVFVKQETTPKPTYERWQWGGSIGGPIVKNRMQFFASFEENRQERDNRVTVGTVTNPPQSLVNDLRRYEGVFISPFTSRLLYAKLSYQPKQGQQADLTYSLRDENEVRGFGAPLSPTTSFESAERFRNRVDSVLGRHQLTGSGWLNEAFLSYQRYRWNPIPANKDLVGRNYQGLLRVGGRSTEQIFVQERFSIRDDFSLFTKWKGSHTLKAGGVLGLLDYSVRKEFDGNPVFEFRAAENWAFPAEARYGAGDPDLSAKNYQVGFFVQDDWAITSRLILNLGLRWDYESDMLNNDYVTPANVRQATAPFVDAGRFFTDGDDRPAFFKAWQPRLGFSYDFRGDGGTVGFGGWGRYYDRVLYNHTLDERFRQQYAVRTFRFSADGSPRDGQPTVRWDPSYLSVAGLEGLIARGVAGNPEVFLLENDTQPPSSDQFTFGLRKKLGPMVTSVSYAGARSRNSFTFIRGNRRPDGTCCASVPGFSAILLSSDAAKTWYDALFVQADKPYGAGGSKWGFSFTYTLGDARQQGGDLFSLDFPRVEDYPLVPTATDERHRVVATGIVSLPYDFLLSTFITLGSGTPYTIDDQSRGSGPNERRLQRNAGRPEQFDFIIPNTWAFRSVDLRLEKIFKITGTQQLSVTAEAFNIFSFDNFTTYDGFIPPLPRTNPNAGKPRALIDPGHRLQFGARYIF